MKESLKKPQTSPVKKKKRKKPGLSDKLSAVFVAAALIAIAVLGFMVAVHLRPEKITGETAQNAIPVAQPVTQAPAQVFELPEQRPPAEIAPALRPEAAVQRPPVQRPPPEVTPPPPVVIPETQITVPETPELVTAAALPPAGIPERPPAPSRGTLVFVIDDAGNNLRELEPFLQFPGPLTIAVLPDLPYSAETARRVRAAGKELILHQPMEAIGRPPAPGTIRADMCSDEIRAIINRNLDEIWPVAGMNNHEGSLVTMNEEAMLTILALSRERGIFFLDSRTTAETAAPRAARRLGMNIAERDVFIDNIQDRESMIRFINTGLARAERTGSAIMIGHAWSPELAPLLKEKFTDLTERGFTFSTLAELINGMEL